MRRTLLCSVLLAACGGSDSEIPPVGPGARTDLDGAASAFLEQRRVTSREMLARMLEGARRRLDGLRESVSSRPEVERGVFEPRIDELGQRIAELEQRTVALDALEQMDWERAHDALRRDVRSMESALRTLEADLR